VHRLRASLAHHAGGLPATFWWLWAGGLVNALATFIFPFLAVFLTSRGFTPTAAGFTTALFGAGGVTAGPLGGALADRVGRRKTLLLSLVSGAATASVLGLLHSPVLIAATVFAFGLGANLARPALSATVADVVPAADRSRAFGLLYWANNLGIGVSMAVGGFVASRSWLALFLADAGTMLAFAALVWRRIPETRPQGAADGGAREGYGAVLADRRFVLWLALHVAFALVFMQFLVAGTIDMSRHGLAPSAIGLVLSLNGMLIVAVQPWAASRLAHPPPGRVLAVACVLVGAGYGAYALCREAWHYAAATAVWTMGEIAYLPIASALVAELSPAHLRGRYQGAYSLSWGLASCLAPVVGPALLQAAGARALWAACLLVAIAVASGQLALGGARPRAAIARPCSRART
jgi:MFS family permease